MQHFQSTRRTVEYAHLACAIIIQFIGCTLSAELKCISTLLDNIANRVQVSAVQIATVLAEFEELVVLYFVLHAVTVGEPVALAVFLQNARRTRRVYTDKITSKIINSSLNIYYIKSSITWNSSGKLVRITVNNAILQRSSAHSLNTNQDQRLSFERRHPGHLFVQR